MSDDIKVKPKRRRPRSFVEIEVARMEKARDLLQLIRAGHNRGVATAEGVALISQMITTVAMLEHEIGRRLSGGLSPLELAHREAKDQERLGRRKVARDDC